MASKRNNGSRDIGGILRKTSHHHPIVESEPRGGDLLVFGYACKVFRDDEKALHIDQGKHLIPWMGDESLRIDRYDVRAALSDLSQYEPPPGGYTNRFDGLTPAEHRAEQLCEEERYYSLYHNEVEEEMYQEEELKRLHQESSSSYGQVQFDYNNPKGGLQGSKDCDQKAEEADEPFVPPANFLIPASIALPETTKLHAIVEKTAKFISTQGPQMEILIKAKQSNNPQFEFLNQNNRLNPYYKFVLASFKNGTYPEQTAPEQSDPQPVKKSENTNSEPVSQPVFAHPSSVRIPTVKYRPSADCAYTQLISKIKGVPIPLEESEDSGKASETAESVPSLYYSPYYAANHHAGQDSQKCQDAVEPGRTSQPAAIIAPSDGVEIKKISSGLMLAQCYASDTEDESETEEHKSTYAPAHFTVPPESLQNIVDKTAIYVAKNGKQFEEILRTKQDERFTFLDTSNEFYPYYLHKVTSLNSSYVPGNGSSRGSDKPKVITPVSFSIKSKDDSSVPINPALLQETSDDDDAENKAKSEQQQQQSQSSTAVPEKPSIPATPSPNAIIAAATAARITAAIAAAAAAANAATNPSNSTKSRFDIDSSGAVVNRSGTLKLETTQQKELKRAEEKVKDRLAQVAREKLGLISKEKQLQLERKKRAMAFLNQIKGSSVALTNPSPTASSTSTPPLSASKNASEDSDDASDTSSIHSIPINSSSLHIDNDEMVDLTATMNGAKASHRLQSVERRSRSAERKPLVVVDHDDDDDDVISVPDDEKFDKRESRRKQRHDSRSGSKDSSSRRHKKKKSKHRSKKKSKKRSRSRSRSQSVGNGGGTRDKKRTKRSADDSPNRRKAKKKRRHERTES